MNTDDVSIPHNPDEPRQPIDVQLPKPDDFPKRPQLDVAKAEQSADFAYNVSLLIEAYSQHAQKLVGSDPETAILVLRSLEQMAADIRKMFEGKGGGIGAEVAPCCSTCITKYNQCLGAGNSSAYCMTNVYNPCMATCQRGC